MKRGFAILLFFLFENQRDTLAVERSHHLSSQERRSLGTDSSVSIRLDRELSLGCPLWELSSQSYRINVVVTSEVPIYQCNTQDIAKTIQRTVFSEGLQADNITYGALMCPQPTLVSFDDYASYVPEEELKLIAEYGLTRRLRKRDSGLDEIDSSANETLENSEHFERFLQGGNSYNWGGGGTCSWCDPNDDDCNTPGCRRRRRRRLVQTADAGEEPLLQIEHDLQEAIPPELREHVDCYEDAQILIVTVVLYGVPYLLLSSFSCLLSSFLGGSGGTGGFDRTGGFRGGTDDARGIP